MKRIVIEKSGIKEARKRIVYGLSGGAAGIRTLVPVKANGFQDRLVMTTSIQLLVLLFSCQSHQNKSSGVTLGAHLRLCSFNGARQVPILLGLYRNVKSRSTGFQDRLVMTTSIQLRVPSGFPKGT